MVSNIILELLLKLGVTNIKKDTIQCIVEVVELIDIIKVFILSNKEHLEYNDIRKDVAATFNINISVDDYATICFGDMCTAHCLCLRTVENRGIIIDRCILNFIIDSAIILLKDKK